MKSRSGTTKFISNSLGRIKDNWRRFAKFRYVIKRQKESIRLFVVISYLGLYFADPRNIGVTGVLDGVMWWHASILGMSGTVSPFHICL